LTAWARSNSRLRPGTTSESLGDPVPAQVKQERYERLMELQQGISLQINQAYVGKTLDILIEGVDKDIAIGRSYRDAPEIDGVVLVEGKAKWGRWCWSRSQRDGL